MNLQLVLTIATFSCIALPLCGQNITVQNNSFEDPALSPGGYTGNQMTDGFIFVYSGIQYAGGEFNLAGGSLPGPASGNQYAFMNGVQTADPNDLRSYLYQDVGALQANTTYTLTVAVGWRNDQPVGAVDLGFVNGTAYNALTPAGVIGESSPFTATLQGGFTDYSFAVNTGNSVSGDLTIFIDNASGNGLGSGPTTIDNVRLTAEAVPEPASMSLGLTSGLIWFVRFGRKKCRNL